MKLSLRKFNFRLLLLLIVPFFTISALAEKNVKYFEALSTSPAYNYSYVSPAMLKMWGDTYISGTSQAYNNLPIQCKDLTSIENIFTQTEGQNEELWKIIHKIKKDKNMETLTTKKSDNYRYDVLVTLSKDGKKILNLMVVTQTGSDCVDVVYLEGKVPLESIQYTFY
ncbi:MAG: DUF4252 domain-containing protein [Bacteroides sp.]|nr:DUF4252 domain-containing protein [Bacteroides sp.]